MEAFEKIKVLIDANRSFVLEAGAGSGKTYTLIQTINHILIRHGEKLKYNNQQIVCITYTNVAKNEIISRLENNPLVAVSTIHEFLWDCIKRYNSQLIVQLDRLNDLMHNPEKPDKFLPGLKNRISQVTYDDSSFRDFESGKIEHDDVISLSKLLFENYERLTDIVAVKYPFIFIDEYQDTASETVESLIEYLLERNNDKVLLGFYGDSYQKIYDSGIGSLKKYIDSKQIDLVTKEENYRCSKKVIEVLNNIRTNIKQIIPPDKATVEGSVKFVNCTNYGPVPKKGIREYNQSIVPQKTANYEAIITDLQSKGWNFNEGSDDKILIIANSRVAERGGFGNLYRIFSARYGMGVNDQIMKRENIFLSFFLGSVDKKTSLERETGIEHLVAFYMKKDYGRIMDFLKMKSFNLKVHKDKEVINKKVLELIELRKTGTVQQVFEFAITNGLMYLTSSIGRFQDRINVDLETIEDAELRSKIERDIAFYNSLMSSPYHELIQLFKHTQNQTVFSTKHGTKGEEYRNVLVVIDDTSWPQEYNFQDFIDDSEERPERKLRSQNLFYVSCSRAKENLVVLSLSKMESAAMTKITQWFGSENITTIS